MHCMFCPFSLISKNKSKNSVTSAMKLPFVAFAISSKLSPRDSVNVKSWVWGYSGMLGRTQSPPTSQVQGSNTGLTRSSEVGSWFAGSQWFSVQNVDRLVCTVSLHPLYYPLWYDTYSVLKGHIRQKSARPLRECIPLPKYIMMSKWENTDYFLLYPEGDPDHSQIWQDPSSIKNHLLIFF